MNKIRKKHSPAMGEILLCSLVVIILFGFGCKAYWLMQKKFTDPNFIEQSLATAEKAQVVNKQVLDDGSFGLLLNIETEFDGVQQQISAPVRVPETLYSSVEIGEWLILSD